MFPEPLRVAAEICPAIYEYYGMHETGTLTLSTPEDRKLHPDSIGVPLLFAEVRIERPDGSIAAPGEIGEIVGRSTATCTSYFDNRAKSDEIFRGGFVHTGDLGAMNEDGFVSMGLGRGSSGFRRLGMPMFSARSLALDGVSWAQCGYDRRTS
jgi:acyl-CoA synthetase (AMP-forming)/AMP-acid ligase II